ncbi:N-acetyltransferase [Aliigemmobacter aestuarii]|uniref:N-acetyltransferase n=1 Tax=Aliigemmobacter aestuarii TaxID=1445661 RepID=A0A4S3MRP1_9RHOB|nr:GNAT family N-acetyltransferase [Gemmobacter aestuarii]THD85178.1 N-acetyltransferase [Gemmobacter aestuarii]
MIAPTLHTERLTLRMPRLADFEPRVAFYASDRSVWEGGPKARASVWREWASDVGQWPLMGYGPFAVDMGGDYVGEVGIYHAADFPAPELGWFVTPAAEGRGIALEAARAVMGWVRRALGWDEIINIIDPANVRSIALGLRLGGRIDPARAGIDPGDVVIVHDLRGVAA